MSAVLGELLDKLSFTNEISVKTENPDILSVLQRNNFLTNYGYATPPDVNNTTIRYLKLKPSESRYFNSYVMNELLSRPDLPAMTVFMNLERLKAGNLCLRRFRELL